MVRLISLAFALKTGFGGPASMLDRIRNVDDELEMMYWGGDIRRQKKVQARMYAKTLRRRLLTPDRGCFTKSSSSLQGIRTS